MVRNIAENGGFKSLSASICLMKNFPLYLFNGSSIGEWDTMPRKPFIVIVDFLICTQNIQNKG